MQIREFTWDDYEAALALWTRLDMVMPELDNRQALAGCVECNPGLFLVGTDLGPAGERLVATVIGTFDGRRGYLYHMAVDPDCRRQGYGQAILEEMLHRLWARGARKVLLRAHYQNSGAIAFYESMGLSLAHHIVGMSIVRPA